MLKEVYLHEALYQCDESRLHVHQSLFCDYSLDMNSDDQSNESMEAA